MKAVPKVEIWPGVKMPLVGAGTWQYNNSQAYTSLCNAFEAGYAYVDTADNYRNQVGVGQAIQDCWLKKGRRREDLFVTTKVDGGLTAEQTIARHAQNLIICNSTMSTICSFTFLVTGTKHPRPAILKRGKMNGEAWRPYISKIKLVVLVCHIIANNIWKTFCPLLRSSRASTKWSGMLARVTLMMLSNFAAKMAFTFRVILRYVDLVMSHLKII